MYYMKGYVFHYYKYGNTKDENDSSQMHSQKKCQQTKKKPDEPEDYITFGEYDRVAIAQVDDFTRFRDLSPNTVKWRGKRRSILLYELQEDKYPLRIKGNDGISCNFGFKFENMPTQIQKRLFMGLTIITVSDEVRTSENFETFLKNVRKEILNKLDNQSESTNDIEYEVFGTLGSTGIAIIWFADQYSTILSSVEKINKFKVVWEGSSSTEAPRSCFTSLYTLLSKNRIKAQDEEANKINKIRGKGILSFALKKQIGSEAMKEILTNCLAKSETDLDLKHCMGEYDYWCEIEVRDVYSKFDTLENPEDFQKQLNSKNEKFRDNILRTKLDSVYTK